MVILVILVSSFFGIQEADMARTMSLAEAKARLSECVRDAEQGKSVVLTRHGKIVAAIVPAVDLERLDRLRAAGPEGGLASLAGGWEGSEELIASLAQRERDRRGRGDGRSSSRRPSGADRE